MSNITKQDGEIEMQTGQIVNKRYTKVYKEIYIGKQRYMWYIYERIEIMSVASCNNFGPC